jgi:alpha-mannosidase
LLRRRSSDTRYGKDLPVLSGDMTPYWEDGAASTSADLAINRHAKEELDQGLRLWTLLAPEADLRSDADRAWYNAVMYDEHTWGAHCSISQPFSEFTISQEKYKQQFAWKARELARRVVEQALASHTAQNSTTIDIYNTASWDRSGPVLLPAEQSQAGHRLVAAAGQRLPTQRLATGELAVLAPAVPAFGAMRCALRAGDAESTGDVTASGDALENDRIRIEIDPQSGSIHSLFDKTLAKEFVDRTQGFGVNDYLYTLGRVTGQGYSRISGDAKISVEDPGPVVGTLRIESAAPGCKNLVRRVRIYAGLDRVDLINEIDKAQELQPEGVYFAFPFQVPGGQPRIDVPFGVVRPEKDQLPGANRNYYCVQRWVDVSNDDFGITWVTLDAPMLQFHPFRIIGRGRGCLPEASMMFDKTPDGVPDFWLRSIDPGTFFYSWVMTNHWETNYRAYQEGPHRFVYSLITHRGGFDPVAAQRLGRGLCQPLLAVAADPAKPVAEPLLRMDGEGVVVTAIHPSRDGKALMVRLFNTANDVKSVRLRWGRPTGSTWISNPGEEPLERAPATIELGKLGVATLRVDRLGGDG